MATETRATPRPALNGLDDVQVAQRVAAGAVNAVPAGPSRTVAEIIRANTLTLFNFILVAMLVLVFIVSEPQDALFGIVLVTNSAIGIIQELRAKKTLDNLALLSAPSATVIRNGSEQQVAVDSVVLDDLLTLRPGDQLVVDGVVVAADSLEVNESLLTGESDPIMKDRGAEVLSGSFVSSGTGVYKARRVGRDAYAARLAEEAKRFALAHSELRNGIDRVLTVIAWILPFLVAILVWSQLNVEDADLFGIDSWREALRGTIAGMVAMIPQGLVLLLSVAFAVGVIRLARRKVLVQELPAVEGLARVDVVCFDKTGTLTEGRLMVEEVVALSPQYQPAAPLGAVAAADPSPNATMQAIATAFPEPTGWRPTATVPFSSARKWSGASFGRMGGWVLGAPEMILPNHPAVVDHVHAAAARGRRVLLLARSSSGLSSEGLPDDLEPVAIVSLGDRIRADAADTLRYFSNQGVAAKVISGDHPQTVAAIAAQAGVADADKVVDARSLPESGPELDAAIEQGTVFGRVSPHQKRSMVGALQRNGHVVAMTGDGVNDVLALKDADIGIAMGSGSSATRSVAQLVLLEGNFDTLPAVVAEGRRVIANIERVANLFVTKTVYAFLMIVLIGVFVRPFPFLPRHLTLVGSLTIGVPAFFLALAPSAHRARPGFLKRVLSFSVPVGAVAAAATYLAYELAIHEQVDLTGSQTLATLVLVSIGFFALIMVSRPFTPLRRVLIGTMAAVFVVVLASPSWRDFFELTIPPLIVVLAGVGIVGITGAVLYGSLRGLGWVQQVPELLRTPIQQYGAFGALRSGMSRLREKARRIGEPLDPDDMYPPPPDPPPR
jgi:cation-transporting ATPase E